MHVPDDTAVKDRDPRQAHSRGTCDLRELDDFNSVTGEYK
jgi:hypothetical protein